MVRTHLRASLDRGVDAWPRLYSGMPTVGEAVLEGIYLTTIHIGRSSGLGLITDA